MAAMIRNVRPCNQGQMISCEVANQFERLELLPGRPRSEELVPPFCEANIAADAILCYPEILSISTVEGCWAKENSHGQTQ